MRSEAGKSWFTAQSLTTMLYKMSWRFSLWSLCRELPRQEATTEEAPSPSASYTSEIILGQLPLMITILQCFYLHASWMSHISSPSTAVHFSSSTLYPSFLLLRMLLCLLKPWNTHTNLGTPSVRQTGCKAKWLYSPEVNPGKFQFPARMFGCNYVAPRRVQETFWVPSDNF